MTAAWQGHDEGIPAPQTHGFTVWDCEPLGYWHRELPGQVNGAAPLKLARVDAKELWQLITHLLPAAEEFTATPQPS